MSFGCSVLQLTQMVQADGTVLLMAAPQQEEQEAVEHEEPPASPAAQQAEAGMQLLQLPNGQQVQISGLEPGQQLVVQQQQQPHVQADDEEGACQGGLLVHRGARGGSDGPSSSGKQHTPFGRRHPLTSAMAEHMQAAASEGGGGGFSKGLQQTSCSQGAANMEVDGPTRQVCGPSLDLGHCAQHLLAFCIVQRAA